MASTGYNFTGVPSVSNSPDLAIRSGGFSFGDASNTQSGKGIFGGLDDFLSTFSLGSSGNSPAYKSGYNVTGGVVSSPTQISTAQVDGSAGWQNSMAQGLAGIMQMIGATGDNTAQPTMQPASYTTSAQGGTDWGMILFLVAGAGLAIYAASK